MRTSRYPVYSKLGRGLPSRQLSFSILRDCADVGGAISRVAYPLAADNVSGLLPIRLRGGNRSGIRTRSVFSRPRSILLVYI